MPRFTERATAGLAKRARAVLTQSGVLLSRPIVFVFVAAYAAAWIILDRATFDWHAFATMATWFMTLFIQRATHRDTQAIQAKLDELIRTDEQARTEITALDRREPEEIERHRRREEQRPAGEGP